LAVGDVRAQEQDSDGARKERGHRVQDDVELHTRHVVERLRDAVADRRVRQSANAARPNAQPLRAIGKHPQAADEHLRDAGGQDEEEGRLRGRASVLVKSFVMFSGSNLCPHFNESFSHRTSMRAARYSDIASRWARMVVPLRTCGRVC
jgi:hypothetical protein